MRLRGKAKRIAGAAILAAATGFVIYGLYRTTTSKLSPSVWPQGHGEAKCWPVLDWPVVQRVGSDAYDGAFENATNAIDHGALPDLNEAPYVRVTADLGFAAEIYERKLRAGDLGGVPISRDESPLENDNRVFVALPRLHALMLGDIASELGTAPSHAIQRLTSVLDATYSAATSCSMPRLALVWALNLRRTLDLANTVCVSHAAPNNGVETALNELGTWASDRKLEYRSAFEPMFIADYHRTRAALSELIRDAQRWIVTWLPYNAHEISLAVDACYVELHAYGGGILWPSPSTARRVLPTAELHGLARSGADALCGYSESAWRALVGLNDAGLELDARLDRLRQCVDH